MRVPLIGHAGALALLLSIVPAGAGPARERPAVWRLETMDLRIEIDPDRGRLKGEARLSLATSAAGAEEIRLRLNDELSVASIIDSSGRPVAFERDGASLTIRPAGTVAGSAVVCLRYEGAFTKRNPDVGFYGAWVGPAIAYGLSGRWYPVLAGDSGRSRGSISYLVPRGWVVAGVGRLIREGETPAGRRFDFAVAAPTGYSFAAGPFRFARRNVDGLDMGAFMLGGEPKKPEFYLENCARVIAFLREYYGGFPDDSFSLVEIPQDLLGSAGGGAEEGFVFFPPAVMPEGYFFAPAFGHEIGHMFWGRVDSADGVIISEGLAEVSMGLYLERAFGEQAFRTMVKNGAPELLLGHSARLYFHSIQSPLTGVIGTALGTIGPGEDLPLGVPVPGKRNTLHTLANSKGWFVFTMLRDLVGAEAFRAGLRSAMSRYAGKRLTLAGLRAEFETAAGRDLKWFFDQWFFRTGAPEFALSWSAVPEGTGWLVKGRIRQIRDVYRVAAEIVFVGAGGRESRVVEISAAETEFSFVLPFKPETVLFDPDYRILRWTDEFKI